MFVQSAVWLLALLPTGAGWASLPAAQPAAAASRFARHRLTNVVWRAGNTVLASFGYTLNATGQRLTLAETRNGTTRNYTWSYDFLSRLGDGSVSGGTVGSLGYGHDAVGNRLGRSGSLGSLGMQSLAYDLNDRLDNDTNPATGSTYFDAQGNTTSYGGAAQYDWANRLTNYNAGAVKLWYDAAGNRTKKDAAGTVTQYLVATVNPTGYPQVVEEFTGATPALSRAYTYGLDLISQRQMSGGTVHFYGTDGLGSVKFLAGTGGTVTDTYTYDAYGTLLTSTGTTPNAYRYTGEQWDADLGMYYLRARYYRPELGRFWTMDSYEGSQSDPLSLHKYLYAHADPANNTDPTGMFTLPEINIVGSIQSTLQTIRTQGPRVALKAARTPIYNVYYGFASIPPLAIQESLLGARYLLIQDGCSMCFPTHPVPNVELATE